ncbi:hypothetical protein Acr_14g0007190 [Actinidia rufa]|uniref:Putative plant transposon protein domain-containing protein n=1 Tax=Actinidia rufa TaxID=165716 RepID=A0A7J0FR82_9ERIC|nr:hypothetical protein Acr_14g0007190 [Actinidia rufa]
MNPMLMNPIWHSIQALSKNAGPNACTWVEWISTSSNEIYSKLVRLFYCNLEVGNLYTLEYTIDSKVRGKTIVLTPTTLSEITGIANEGELVFISKPSQLKEYVSKSTMYDVIAGENIVKVTETVHLKKEFRLFHRYIAHNIISKAGHFNQVTTLDAFIIYKAAIDEPLNLNYIILKEMADVRNHNTRAFPYGALLTKQGIDFDPSGEEKEEKEGVNDMNEDVNQDPPYYADPNLDLLQLPWGDDENLHQKESFQIEIPMEEDPPRHKTHPFQEGTPSHGGVPSWAIEL